MSDIEIKEIQEEIFFDQLFNMWRRYKKMIIGSAVALSLITITIIVIVHYQTQTRHQASSLLFQMMKTETQKNTQEYQKTYNALLSMPDPYPMLARFVHHNSQTQQETSGHVYEQAKETLHAIINDIKNDPTLREAAIILLSMMCLDNNDLSDKNKELIEKIAHSKSSWTPLAQELQAFIAMQNHDPRALSLFESIANAPDQIYSVKERAQIMIDSIKASS